MPDPVARSMQAMLDHMHAVDERIERMCSTLRKLDANYRDGQLPALRDRVRRSNDAKDSIPRGSFLQDNFTFPTLRLAIVRVDLGKESERSAGTLSGLISRAA